jgi:hypothetical protein
MAFMVDGSRSRGRFGDAALFEDFLDDGAAVPADPADAHA